MKQIRNSATGLTDQTQLKKKPDKNDNTQHAVRCKVTKMYLVKSDKNKTSPKTEVSKGQIKNLKT